MNDFNQLTLMGRLTKDPALKNISANNSVVNFSIGNNRKYNDKEETLFLDCTAFGKLAETLNKYLKKGNQVLLSGRLKQDKWEKDGKTNYKIYLLVESFQIIYWKPMETKEQSKQFEPTQSEEMPF